MSARLQAYEQHQFARHHYRNLVSAKTTLAHTKTHSQSFSLSKTLTPLDRFEYKLANDKIKNKLTEIYDQKPVRVKSKRKKQKLSRASSFSHKENARTLKEENAKLYERILSTRSTIGDLKER
jgi:arginine/lysine/ornithine decarboxylase